MTTPVSPFRRRPRRRTLARVLAPLGAAGAVVTAVAASGGAASGAPAPASGGPSVYGSFSAPFVEPTIAGQKTSEKCIPQPDGTKGPPGGVQCKPAGASVNVMPNGKVLYWDALEGTENVKASIVTEYGHVSVDDQSRVLQLGRHPRWHLPKHANGGANPNGDPYTEPLVPGTQSNEHYNDGALFCSDQLFLADGRVLAAGGTSYYDDPSFLGTGTGEAELQGLHATRIYNPSTDDWTQTGDMHYGRWYPSLVELGNGQIFAASGVRKLVKPVYTKNIQGSGTNVKQTETYDPRTGRWTDNGPAAEKSLPLFPRIHLLPDGHVFYAAAGQTFNPFGQSYDEALWSVASSYDPKTKTWADLGVPGIGTSAPGFRGSTFSTMLTLRPDSSGQYRTATFLDAGGTVGPTPGSYIATTQSSIDRVTTYGGPEKLSSKEVQPMPEGRWYSSGVLLPTGQVIAFSGADRDEVEAPGTEFPRKQAILFDPITRTWRPLAIANRVRTYHNTAVLLPDGRVLVGGHAPITTGYTKSITLPGGKTAPNEGRDPTFEIFSPPYIFKKGRPTIRRAAPEAGYHGRMNVAVDTLARNIRSVVLVHNPSTTHVVDASQRTVELPIVRKRGHVLTVATPPNGNVAPPGPYMLFVNRRTKRGLIPSRSKQVFVGKRDPRGRARLSGPRGCVTRTTAARITGRSIESVTFTLDGRHRIVEDAGAVKHLSVKVNPRRLRVGRHTLVARVRFLVGSHTREKRLTLTFRRCRTGARR